MLSFFRSAFATVLLVFMSSALAATNDFSVATNEILRYQGDIVTRLEPIFAEINTVNQRVVMDIDAHIKAEGIDFSTTDTQIDITTLTNGHSQVKFHSISDIMSSMLWGNTGCRASADLELRSFISEIFIKFDTLSATTLGNPTDLDACPDAGDAGITLGKFMRIGGDSLDTVDVEKFITEGRVILSELRQKPLWTVVSQKNPKTYILEPNIENIASVFRLTEDQKNELIYEEELNGLRATLTIASPDVSSLTIRDSGTLIKMRRIKDVYILSVKDGSSKGVITLTPSLVSIVFKDGTDTLSLNYKNEYLTIKIKAEEMTVRIEGPYTASGNTDLSILVQGLKIGWFKNTVQGNSFVSHGEISLGDPAEVSLTFDIKGTITTGTFTIDRPTDFITIGE